MLSSCCVEVLLALGKRHLIYYLRKQILDVVDHYYFFVFAKHSQVFQKGSSKPTHKPNLLILLAVSNWFALLKHHPYHIYVPLLQFFS